MSAPARRHFSTPFFNARLGAILVGLKLFIHSVRLVFTDFDMALRIGGVPLLLHLALTILATAAWANPQFGLAVGLPLFLIAAVAFIWFAVAWHRYVLMDELPIGFIPRFSGERSLAYWIAGIIVGILSALPGALTSLFLIFATIWNGMAPVVLAFTIVAYAIGTIVFFRVGLILPASALKRRLKVKEAWALTSGKSGTIVVLAVIAGLAAVLLQLIGAGFAGQNTADAIIRTLWGAVSVWLQLVVGVSILTTLYGFYVEKRPIGTLVPS